MSEGVRRPREDMEGFADVLVRRLRPAYEVAGVPAGGACVEIEVAGSFRREEETIGDLEIVILPVFDRVSYRSDHLFSDEIPVEPGAHALDAVLEYWCQDGFLVRDGSCQGPLHKKFEVGVGELAGLHVDVYLATEENWGNILAIRTGPWRFSNSLVTQWSKVTREGLPGLMPDYLFHRDGRLWYRAPGGKEELYKCPTEGHFWRALKLPYVPARERSVEMIEVLRSGSYVS